MRPIIFLLLATSLGLAPICLAESKSQEPWDTSGWYATGPSEDFDKRTVFKAINGAAETYLQYGFQKLRIRTFKHASSLATVNLFDLGRPINAFGIFSKERPSKGQRVDAGDRALSAPPFQCLMHQGRYYVLIAASKGRFIHRDCQDMLKAMSAVIPKGTGKPKELSLLPTEHMIEASQGYTPKSFLGLGSLNRCVHARYKDKADREYMVFAVLPQTQEETPKAIWQRLQEGWTDKADKSASVRVREIPYRGPAALLLTSKAVLGVVDLDDQAQTMQVIHTLADK